MADLPTAEDLRRAALYCPTSIRAGARQLPRLLHALADALDAGTVRLVRMDDEPPEGWVPSSGWWDVTDATGERAWLSVTHGSVLITPADDDDGSGYDWSLPHGYPDDAVHRAPSLRVAQYRAEAALRAAGERVPR